VRGDVECSGQVHGEHRLPLLVAHVDHAPVAGDAGVVDEQGDRVRNRGDRRGYACGIGDVDLVEPVRDRIPLRSRCNVEDVDAGAVVDQGPGDRQPDAAGAAGDHRDAPMKIQEITHRPPSPATLRFLPDHNLVFEYHIPAFPVKDARARRNRIPPLHSDA